MNSVSAIELELSLIVLPDDTELNDSFGDGNDFEGSLVLGVLLEEGAVLEGRGQLYQDVLDGVDDSKG